MGQFAKGAESEVENGTVKPVDLVGVAHSSHKSKVSLKQMCSVLPPAKAKVYGEKGMCIEATLLFDSGSDKSYVSSRFAKRIKPTWATSEQISYSAFGGGNSSKAT